MTATNYAGAIGFCMGLSRGVTRTMRTFAALVGARRRAEADLGQAPSRGAYTSSLWRLDWVGTPDQPGSLCRLATRAFDAMQPQLTRAMRPARGPA